MLIDDSKLLMSVVVECQCVALRETIDLSRI